MYLLIILTFMCFARGALTYALLSPCSLNDVTCIEKTVNAALPKIFEGIPELGIESLDPEFLEIIEINLPTVKFTLSNCTLYGLKNFKISSLKFNEDVTTVHCGANGSNLTMTGQYEVDGQLSSLPIKGKGDFRIESENIALIFDFQMKKSQGNDKKNHLSLLSYKLNSKAQHVNFEFLNLFDGQKDLADDMQKFLREHWLEVTDLVQYPLWTPVLKKLIANVNKYLQSFALEEVLLNALEKTKSLLSAVGL